MSRKHIPPVSAAEERRLIDEAVAAGRVRVIPRGVTSDAFGLSLREAHKRKLARIRGNSESHK